ncbi:putative RNA polymerase II subunit B1 CTD phosphatase RPAP2 isoform X2 [Dendropsophus ebraccatus]|uniref:putative RNA polymerase II subunit B1 CTD phosphatase RPAP2 isoform X2 n=1 Tax=Dendropsophus ebraccatus TaxID=150705 RepID=UPI0038312757
MVSMAEKRGAGRSRKSPRKSAGTVHFSDDINSEDAAKRRAALENAVRKKIETERRALQIVERLLEERISEEFLMDCARFISPSYYKDIVEERSIVMMCGYPICNKKLENVPKQKYKISTKTNKVYDITERKCFCSNFCYRASKYYEAQIPKTPVWSRDEESPPHIKLLKEGRSSGEEVLLTERPIKMSEVEKPKRATERGDANSASSEEEEGEPEQAFVSSLIPEQSHKEAESAGDGGDVTQRETPDMADTERKVEDATERLRGCSLNDNDESSDPQRVRDVRAGSEVAPEVTRRALSKSGAEHLRKLLSRSRNREASGPADVPPVVVKRSMLEILTQTLRDWRSEDTLRYLYGADYVVERNEPPRAQEPDLDEDDLVPDVDDIEENSDAATLNESLPYESNNRESQPLLNYSKLQEETQMLEIRVREFFRGRYVLPEEAERERDEHEGGKDATWWAPPLPLVDSFSQQQVRRRIVLEKLKKVLPAILIPLKITYSDVSKELHDLVKTFRFTNTNITHTFPEWSIIAIVLLSVLLPTMPLHKDSEQNPLYTQFVSKLLEELHFQKEDLECLKRDFASHTLSLSS